ncbi:hypothetical protein Tco_0194743 [Tanacetum coccineum]
MLKTAYESCPGFISYHNTRELHIKEFYLGNTKKDKILQTPSSTQKNKVEAHHRKVKSSLKNKDCVVEPKGTAHVQHSKINANTKLKCVKCNGCMLSDNHDLCVLDFINNVNARNKSKSVKKSSKRKVWKPTGKVFTNIGYIWRPTSRTFTIVGNACPLTRITTTTEVPLRKPTALENETPKPVITLDYSRKPRKSKTNVPFSKSKVIQIVLWYLDSGCSKHMTGDRSQLTNFVNKFLGTQKNKVEAHHRKVKSSLKNKDYVVEPKGTTHVQHSKIYVNTKLKCVKCNGCMLSDNHDFCVLDFINNVNARNKSKSVKKSSKRKVWKPTGKMFTNIGYIWRPTGRTITIVGNVCPLTRITTTTEVPFRKPTALENETPKPVITLDYSREPRKSKTNVPISKSKVPKSVSANKKEPSQSWGSIVSNVPSSSLDECRSSKLFSGIWTSAALSI